MTDGIQRQKGAVVGVDRDRATRGMAVGSPQAKEPPRHKSVFL